MSDFTFVIDSEQLAKGLRKSKRSLRNTGFLIESKGAIGLDGVLSAIENLSRIDTSVITDSFPFPQLFVFTNLIIVCSSTTVYEWNGTALVSKLSVTAGATWKALDFFDYVYLSNGTVAVIRSAETGVYAESSSLPTALSMVNFNGQVVIGVPDTTVDGASLTPNVSSVELTITQHGEWS